MLQYVIKKGSLLRNKHYGVGGEGGGQELQK